MAYVSQKVINKSPMKQRIKEETKEESLITLNNQELSLDINILYFLVTDMFNFISATYTNKILNFIIPNKMDQHQITGTSTSSNRSGKDKLDKVLEQTNKYKQSDSEVNRLNNLFLLINHRVAFLKLKEYKLDKYFIQSSLRKEIKILQNLEVKILICFYIALRCGFNEEKVLEIVSNIFSEYYQAYLALGYLLINKILKCESKNDMLDELKQTIDIRLFKKPDKGDETFYFSQINKLMTQMITIFINSFINDESQDSSIRKSSSPSQVSMRRKASHTRNLSVLVDALFNIDNYSYFLIC